MHRSTPLIAVLLSSLAVAGCGKERIDTDFPNGVELPRLDGEVPVETRFTVRDPVAIAVLSSLDAWDAANEKQRAAAAAEVARASGGEVAWDEAFETYEAGDQSHVMALFTHARTGLPMTLVPAGTYGIRGVWRESLGGHYFRVGSYSVRGPVSEPDTHIEFLGGRDDVVAIEIAEPFLVSQVELPAVLPSEPLDAARRADVRGARVSLGAARTGFSWLETTHHVRGLGLDLPTATEWEVAGRGGTLTRFIWGDEELTSRPNPDYPGKAYPSDWDDKNHTWGTPRPTLHVARAAPNAFGLYDVHRNVEEYVLGSGESVSGERPDPPFRTYRVTSGWGSIPEFGEFDAVPYGKLLRSTGGVFMGQEGARPVVRFRLEGRN